MRDHDRRPALEQPLEARARSRARSARRRWRSPRPGSGSAARPAAPGRTRSAVAGPRTGTPRARRPRCRSRSGIRRMNSPAPIASAAASISSSLALGTAERDVLANRPGEEEALLRHDPELAAQARRAQVAQIAAVDEHAAPLRVVEPRDQLREGGLPGAGLTDQRQGLTGGYVDRHVLERPVRRVLVVRRARSIFPLDRFSPAVLSSPYENQTWSISISPRSVPGSSASGLSTMSGSVSSRSKILSSAAIPCW